MVDDRAERTQHPMSRRCPGCGLNWWLSPPAKMHGEDAVLCIGCKRVYPETGACDNPDLPSRLRAAADNPHMPEATVCVADRKFLRLAADQLAKLEAVERAARRLIKDGLRTTPNGMVVIEKRDKSDAHYELCDTLEPIAPLNPPCAAAIRAIGRAP